MGIPVLSVLQMCGVVRMDNQGPASLADSLVVERKKYYPRAYGPMVAEFMLRHQRCNLWAPPGFGKTVMIYTALDAMYLVGLETRPTLVLGPLRVARDTWVDEVEKWEHLRDITVSAIVGDAKQRLRALKRDASVYTTNYENLPWLVETLGDKWPFGTVVADESVKIKSFRLRQGGKRAQALAKHAWTGVNRWINATGYPAPNGLQDLWGQMWFIDQGKRLGRTFSAFSERWFHTGHDGFGMHPFAHSRKEIEALIQDVTLALDPKDWFDLKAPIVTDIAVKLPAPAMKVYKEFEKTMFAELLCGTEVEVFNAAALTNKCMQIASGFIYDDKRVAKEIHTAKIEALESTINECSGAVMVAYHFVEDLARLQKVFPNAAVLSTPAGLAQFKAGDAQIGLVNGASLGHGIDGLQNVCNTLIFYGDSWNLDNRIQLMERIGAVRQFQAGLDRPVFIYNILAKDTIDETILARHSTKKSVMDLLVEAMRRIQ